MTEPRDLDEAMEIRAEKRAAMHDGCPSCLLALDRCRCIQRCAECGVLTNHTTEQHRAQLAAQGEDGGVSKASEWVGIAEALIKEEAVVQEKWKAKPRFLRALYDGAGFAVAGEVAANGRLVTGSTTLTPEQACDFARWILATFGDAP